MFSKVRVKKGALDHFRKRAREAFPLEIQVYLLGTVKSEDEVKITDFIYPKEYYTQTRGEVCWTKEEFELLKQRSELEGKRVVAEAHSHPAWDAVLSDADYKAITTEGLFLCGLCSVNKRRTRFRFWTPTSALPCKIVYYT